MRQRTLPFVIPDIPAGRMLNWTPKQIGTWYADTIDKTVEQCCHGIYDLSLREKLNNAICGAVIERCYRGGAKTKEKEIINKLRLVLCELYANSQKTIEDTHNCLNHLERLLKEKEETEESPL
jgi:hypothetical protein